jgi:hypothetical protein
MDDPGFVISRMVISRTIAEREPVNVGDYFSSATERVYCFLEAKDIKEDTMISFVWFWSNQEMTRVRLPLQKGHRWRTYSSKNLRGLKGNWKVELQDASGKIYHSISFIVE